MIRELKGTLYVPWPLFISTVSYNDARAPPISTLGAKVFVNQQESADRATQCKCPPRCCQMSASVLPDSVKAPWQIAPPNATQQFTQSRLVFSEPACVVSPEERAVEQLSARKYRVSPIYTDEHPSQHAVFMLALLCYVETRRSQKRLAHIFVMWHSVQQCGNSSKWRRELKFVYLFIL